LGPLLPALHDCRDDFRLIDEVIHPMVRRKLQIIHRACELKRRLVNTADECKVIFTKVYDYVKNACFETQTGVCTANCSDAVKRGIGLIDRCGSLFRLAPNTTGNLPPFDGPVRDFLRKVRGICKIDARRVDVNVSVDETEVSIEAEDSLRPERPRTNLRVIAKKIIEWIAEKYDRFNDSAPAHKFRFRFRKLHEFRPRNSTTDQQDFTDYGVDPAKDTIVASYDFENDSEVEAFTDYGSLPIYSTNGNATVIPDPSAFRRAFRVATRFGNGRLSRAIFTFIATNIKNGLQDGEVTIPGSASFNIILENIVYKANDTSIALEFDVDLDFDEGVLENNASTVDKDSDGIQLEDNTEGRVNINETRKIRWKRRVFCDGNKEVVVRARFVKTTVETPQGGFLVRKKLFVTFHISRSVRCHRLIWDPSTDIAPEDDTFTGPTGGTTSTTGTTGGTTSTTGGTTTGGSTSTTGGSTATTGTSSSSKLLIALFFAMIAIVLF
jgi:hypothetical protein